MELPADWQLPKAWGEWALAEYPHWTADIVRLEADKFADHWRGKSGKDARKADWLATWRNWCRSDITQRAHPLKRRPSQMTEPEQAAWVTPQAAEAKRLLFGGPAHSDDVIEIETLGLSHEAI